MIRFLPCQSWHIDMIDTQVDQPERQAFNAEVTDDLVANSLALSCWIDGDCVGAGGIRPIWPGRAAAWALLGKNAGPAMPAIVRKLRFVVATYPVRRIEMTVRANFGPGCRLAALLGFNAEARLLGFFPDGSTAELFSRLRPQP